MATASRPRSASLRRLGAAGFAFFLVKGLLWLAVPAIPSILALVR